MTSLILDTSREIALIALSIGDTLVDALTFPHHNDLSATFLPSIHALLEKNRKNPSDLTGIFAGIGPGSYTGTRLALAVAECLALALNLPLRPFCSLLAFIPSHFQEGPFSLFLSAKQGSLFLLEGTLLQGKITAPVALHTLSGREELKYFPSAIDMETPKEVNLSILLAYLHTFPSPASLAPSILYLQEPNADSNPKTRGPTLDNKS